MKKNVLFFWIPKTGGTSIHKVLDKYDCPILTSPRTRWHRPFTEFSNKGFVTFSHVSIPYLLKKGIITKEYFDKAFKFTFVRNPYDRLVSLYHFKEYGKKEFPKTFKGFLKRSKKMSFKKFVFLLYKKWKKRDSALAKRIEFMYKYPLLSRYFNALVTILRIDSLFPLPKVGPYNVRGLSQANPQTDWILDENGKLMVDWVGRFENLNQDHKKVMKKIGIENPPKLSHSRKSRNDRNYKKYYDEETKRIVDEIYKKDIEMFGYKF